ncbi:single-stranded DNA-binding protein [Caryophanon tenue]|uniref:Single-stranded DNA-binding protein n=1 Tax=Caryophanon tenue TaxID=33978 RepID=A0A1C0YL90_9BACL|nr:single-stranded DNA-binding protein [Caryophanon tenue]OCS87911.1 single-stranded DNA-binding protein [Caryophanon tenue]
MINNVVLVGRLTKDPELKMTPSGIAVARFTIAVNRPFTSQGGEKKADFINCIAWRKQAENLANFMRKGGLIGVSGRIETGSYDGQDGKRVYTTEVVADNIQFLESKNSGNQQGAGGWQQPQQQAGYSNNNQYGQQPSYGQQPYGNAPQQAPFTNPAPMQQPPNQQNYTTMNDDPFTDNGNKNSVDISEDDLPF